LGIGSGKNNTDPPSLVQIAPINQLHLAVVKCEEIMWAGPVGARETFVTNQSWLTRIYF